MAKQNINVGTTANDKKGDSLRAAFQKVNANFTELYVALGLDSGGLNLGAFEFTGSTLSTTDSSSIIIDQATTVTSNLSVGGDILPQTANGGDLGSSTLPWRSLYVSNNTIYIGGVALGIDANGNLTTGGTVVGSTPAWANITGKPTFASVATSGAYGDLSGRPTIPTLTSQLTNDSNFITTAVLNNGLNVDIKGSVFADDSTLMVDAVDNKIYATELTVAVGNFVNVNSNNVDVENINGLASQINFTVGGYNNLVIENNLVTIQNVSLSVAGDITLGGNIRSEGNINIEINLSDSTLRRWQFGEDGNLTFPDATVQSTAWTGSVAYANVTGTPTLFSGSYNDLTNKPDLASTYQFSVAADDSTQRVISTDEVIKFIGAGGITTSSDAEGNITITGAGGSVSSLVNSTKTLSLGSDGSLTSNGALTIKTPNGVPSSVSNWVGGGGWNNPPYSNLATTGGTGTGLTVNVSAADGGYININYITIGTAGTGYTAGDVITITNENSLSGTFTIGVAGTRDWQFDINGGLTLPSGNSSSIQSVQDGNYQSKVTVSPFQILSQARTSQSQSYTVADEDFISASSDGAGTITFVNPTGSMTEWLLDTFTWGVDHTVRINGAGPEYEYLYFNGADIIVLNTYPAAGAVTEIRFSYTLVSKIDISPNAGVFRIESEFGQDIDLQSGDDLDIVAYDDVTITAGDQLRLRSGDNYVSITTNHTVPNAIPQVWYFNTSGQLTLPNGAVLRNTANGAIAFGNGAGLNSQGATAIAIGNDAGYYPQGADAVAIGRSAGEGYQGANAIAIGLFAGQNNQAANSIVLNATGVALEQTIANTFTVAPIRNISATSGVLQYNASTKEVSYSLNVTAETFNTDQITIVGNRISTTVTNANLEIECNGTGGVVINTVAEATTASTARSVGYLGVPASTVTTTNTLTIADAGEHIYVTTNGQTITIPANASVAYPIGTTLTFIAGPSPVVTVTIAINTDTLRLAGGTSTGSRTLAANGMATAVKVADTTWYINGTGLT